jgi:hypothetical protein
MVNMQMSAEEAKEETDPSPDDAPRYPWGLCIDLDDDALAKLGITTLPAVGSTMTLQASVTVSRTGAYQTQGSEKEMSLGLQITDMALSSADGPSAASVLYGA